MLNTEARRQLKELLPVGMLATKQWLVAQGLNLHFVDNAVRSKTLLPLAAGVFSQFSCHLNWQGVVASLQRMSETPIHLGGLTALEIAGLAHYVTRSHIRTVHLYSSEPLPRWLTRVPLDVYFKGHRTQALWPENLIADPTWLRQEQWREGMPALQFSCPERAIFEVLGDVPKAVSFEHAEHLMQGLYNLSPRKLDALLLACSSIKVKRLFLWLAEKHQHAWFKKLEPRKYNLGAGKRVITTKGRLDNTWLITVPKDM
ncbi:hypothetical protein TI10_08600 [Photorhabdus luminescens subsp. luminescens]|uniref:Transcriptional regulator, AbiEi antitoxin, Type IV TA system n=1 Tax=Photorhabdus luminescens TaxID=29488 RepID=A0A1G5RGX7_PHOLU|nr:type IV toxin-antitoxin system AbiEi family antitoxin [Photorhabdus luminescens]KMW73163.1 hypothetical protein TI10_08600 [Photorhabdus luminescens subsp. luminescens]SCZ72621.1 Transcriptional regulator, AbiEi antitoxin, Type IV TA system [Photorhabdus luminescens]